MWLKALLELLLLPPVNLVFAILAGVALRRRAPRVARYLIVVGATLLLALGMPAVAGTLLWSLEQGLPMTPPPGKPPQAIVILGGDVARDGAWRRHRRITDAWNGSVPAPSCSDRRSCPSWSPAA